MGKFEELYESVISEFVKPTKDVTDKEIFDIAKEVGLDDEQSEKLVKLLKTAFSDMNLSSAYIKEWAERIKKGTAFNYADSATRKVLKGLGITESINEDDYEFYILTNDGKIFSGWEYKEDAKDSLEDMPNGVKGKVITLKGLKGKGIDPEDDENWYTGK